MATRVVQPPGAWVFDVPLIGDDLAKIGRAIDIYADPCKPTAEIWMYGFFQAIPTLFVTLTKPELIDINIRHRGRKPRKGKKFRFTPSHIFRDAIIEVPVPRWVIFRVWELSQRIGWYFLVADALEDFSINWMTLAYKYNGCQSPFINYVDANTINRTGGGVSANTPARWTWSNFVRSGFDISNNQALPVNPGKYRVTWSATFKPYPIPSLSELPYTTNLWIGNQAVDVGELAQISDGRLFTSSSTVFIWDGGLPRPNIYITATQLHATKFYIVDAQWNIDRVEDNELDPDP